jgi:hypothetical protein
LASPFLLNPRQDWRRGGVGSGTPIGAITIVTSEKRNKQLANRRLRAAMRSAGAIEAELLPGMRDVSDPWTFDKDGKRWWDAAYPRSLRK